MRIKNSANIFSMIILMVLLSTLAYSELDTYVSKFDPNSKITEIVVYNRGTAPYHDLEISIDDSEWDYFMAMLNPGLGATYSRILPEGPHNIKVRTSDKYELTKSVITAPVGTKKDPSSTPTASEIQYRQAKEKEYDQVKAEIRKKIELEERRSEAAQKALEDAKKAEGGNGRIMWMIIGISAFIALIILVIWLIKKLRK